METWKVSRSTLRGFVTVEGAKKAAEDYSKDLDEPLDLELPEEE
jgi:hypothetical protein